MKKTIYSGALLGLLTLSASAATVWTGNGDGISFFQEANWDNGAGAPSADSINPSSALAVDAYSITGTNLTGVGALTLGNAATSLTLDASSISLSGTGGTNGAGTLSLVNGSSFISQFLNTNLLVNIDGTSTITLKGGATPLNPGSSIELAAGGIINFTGETVTDATNEHLGSITIGGQAVNLGVNATLISDGASGSILTATAAVPEPSSAALLGLGGVALILRRRK